MSSPTSSSSLLLCVLIKSAKIQISNNECYSYVVLKIDNVKSTTSVVKGQQPNWEQEFYFDVPDCSAGLQIELWKRGQFRDQLLGLCYIIMDQKENGTDGNTDAYRNGFNERWINLDAEWVLNNQGQISRTCKPTEHSLLICSYIELPSDLTEEESRELTEKLEILHEILHKKGRQLQDVALDEINSLSTMHLEHQPSLQYQQLTQQSHSHFSDDSAYTSDVSYPLNIQSNITNSLLSMSQSNLLTSTNENHSPSKSTKKPLAFVQPVIRDLTSSRKFPMNRKTDLTNHQKK